MKVPPVHIIDTLGLPPKSVIVLSLFLMLMHLYATVLKKKLDFKKKNQQL